MNVISLDEYRQNRMTDAERNAAAGGHDIGNCDGCGITHTAWSMHFNDDGSYRDFGPPYCPGCGGKWPGAGCMCNRCGWSPTIENNTQICSGCTVSWHRCQADRADTGEPCCRLCDHMDRR